MTVSASWLQPLRGSIDHRVRYVAERLLGLSVQLDELVERTAATSSDQKCSAAPKNDGKRK